MNTIWTPDQKQKRDIDTATKLLNEAIKYHEEAHGRLESVYKTLTGEWMKSDIRQDFIYPEITEETRKYGNAFLSRPIINPTGDYRDKLPLESPQRRYGVEPSTCYLFAQTHADATYEEAVFDEHDNDYAERFPAQFTGGTPQGGNPIKGANAIYDNGSVPEESMPFDKNIKSWEEYHSWKGVDKNKVIQEGKDDRKIRRRYGVVLFERNTPLETKYKLMEEASKRGVVCISVWGVQEGNTYAPKPPGIHDTHMVQVTYLEKNLIHTLDTYEPFQKILPPNYNPDFGMVRYVEKNNTDPFSGGNWIQNLWRSFMALLRDIWDELWITPVTEK
jgi:hypothetical protein